MAQMPEEGRKFGIVDSYWKDIMGEAVSGQQTLLYSLTFTQLNRYFHWLILGHVALTKIKSIPIVIH